MVINYRKLKKQIRPIHGQFWVDHNGRLTRIKGYRFEVLLTQAGKGMFSIAREGSKTSFMKVMTLIIHNNWEFRKEFTL